MNTNTIRGRMAALAGGIGVALVTSAAFAQNLTLRGLDGPALTIAPAELAGMPHVALTVTVEGKTSAYRGIPLTSLLARVGAPSGKALKGEALRDVVIVSSRDGYVVVLALAETDPLVRKDQIILADRADGKPLPDTQGPYRLVVEGDLRGARLARMVTSIEVRRLAAASAP